MLVVAGVMLGMLLSALDQTIVGTAMPRIVASLGGMSLYSWVATAYMLSSTASMPIFGKLSDIYGHRKIYLIGLIVFMLGSILSGLSQTMEQLIIFRGLQGLGAGSMMPVAMAIIADIFPPTERGKLQGLMGGVFGLASVIGPAVGGYLTDNLSWHWIFYVNLPVGILAVVVLLIALPAMRASEQQRYIDYAGAATLVAAIVPMLLALVWAGNTYPWLSPQILGLLGFSGAAWGAFIVVEHRAQEPILPLSLFRNPIFTVSVIVVFLTGAGMFGTIMFVPLFVQGVIGTSATDSGMIMTPMMLALILGSIVGGQMISRTGRYRLLAIGGSAFIVVGLYLLSGMGVDSTNDVALRNMIVTGFGLGITMPLFLIAVQNAFEPELMGVVSSSVQFFRSIGGTVGMAVFGTLMVNLFSDNIQQRLTSILPPQIAGQLSPSQLGRMVDPQALLAPGGSGGLDQLPPQLAPLSSQIMLAIRTSLAGSLQQVFLVGMFATIVGLMVCFFLREIPLRRTARGLGSAMAEEARADSPASASSINVRGRVPEA